MYVLPNFKTFHLTEFYVKNCLKLIKPIHIISVVEVYLIIKLKTQMLVKWTHFTEDRPN